MRALASTAFGLLIVSALALRWPIASHDVEHYIGPDEGEVVENVLEMVKTGDFDHRHRGYPGLHFYLQMIPVHARLVATGRTIPELERSDFYRTARRVTLVAGILAGALTFVVGLRLFGALPAALAASLVLFAPLGFRESAVVNPDLVLSFFVALALWFSLRLVDDRSLSSFVLAGAAIGLAAAVKYTGGFALASYALAFFLGEEPRRHRQRALAGLAAAGLAFAAASPYTIVHLPEFFRGLGTHVAYYQASETNALVELAKVVPTRALGWVSALAALAGAVLALRTRDRRKLVVLAFPVVYLFVFAFFDRAFPRHVLPLLPHLALLAAGVFDGLGRSAYAVVLGVGMLASPLWGTAELSRRLSHPTPAERSARWAERELPPGSRVLEDQYTPRLDPVRFLVHRLQVEERVFAGNFDWVFYSGYPPGLDTAGLREAVRFETGDSLGAPVIVFQVPARESLMGVTLAEGEEQALLGAGEPAYFGTGWEPPSTSAFGTERLSSGASSEVFFVLPSTGEAPSLQLELSIACAVCPAVVDLELNGRNVGRVTLENLEPEAVALRPDAAAFQRGLNRIELRYGSTGRLDRRRRSAAVRLWGVRLSRS